MTIHDTEILQDFIVESQEHLANVESQLLTLESQTEAVDVSLVNKVFRAVHSIKGAASFLKLTTLETLAHREEEVLNRLRSLEIRPTSEIINTLLKATDCLKTLLDKIETSNDVDVTDHLRALEQIMNATDGKIDTVSVEKTEENEQPLLDQVNSPSSPSTFDVVNSTLSVNVKGYQPTISAEALREFLIESIDNLEQLESSLVTLERDPCNDHILNCVFRCIHTIKGSAGFLAFKKIESLTHSAENVLGDLRAKRSVLDDRMTSCLFQSIDRLRKMLGSIEKTGHEGSPDNEDLIREFTQIHMEGKSNKQTPDNISPTNTPGTFSHKTAPATVQTPAPYQSVAETTTVIPKSDIKQEVPVPGPAVDATAAHSATDSTIRVDVALLDKLMTRVGELVLARNQILKFSGRLRDSDLQAASQHLSLITSELQESVMKTRMQPIGNVWGKFPRLVRDLAAICGKEVRIEMEGKETELDKTIIEAIKDPLTHLVRNTVDHGIERPEARVAAGKGMEGCLSLRAFHEGGQVNIEISDDGAGLNINRIREKAIEKGLITADQSARMQDREASQLIFLPGFSTAEKVSNVSGRGVGMDVVKTNIEKIGGAVDLHTVPGKGTSVKIKIPLTLAIIPALVVTSAGSRFAIPQVNLLELVRLEGEKAQNGIEWVQGSPVYRLRGRLLPLVHLRQLLKSKHTSNDVSDCINIVVLRVDNTQFGLVVDRINDTEEIVVKPLSKQIKNVQVFAGASIMGDGKVALILDVLGLAHASQVISKSQDRHQSESQHNATDGNQNLQKLLILGTGTKHRLGLPISQVARLEKIASDCIEYANHREVFQYRDEIVPLVRLADTLGLTSNPLREDGMMNVVIYSDSASDKSFGIVIDKIIDIVQADIKLKETQNVVGILGSSIIQGLVTDIIDLPAIISPLRDTKLFSVISEFVS